MALLLDVVVIIIRVPCEGTLAICYRLSVVAFLVLLLDGAKARFLELELSLGFISSAMFTIAIFFPLMCCIPGWLVIGR